ncbi:hypothetical protein [Pseudomonas petrae]|uniref:ABC transporter permease n=1 Tax=Pseudomonas petrae TaxID=2912190 RepID=A0ABS9ICL7_9PSED|nr:hypothetical protein [Pseudomonas petrae]MCF7535084.1 hypothetical protein [Pseudomonas petrae]MCF7539781.1 hypothetical protein [Pseudomonas petrae]MCF7545469.1 hypothetical protein [Pseudomonas petrae]MCF7558383.1 hypothetical protein [Pseudomonas petrae]
MKRDSRLLPSLATSALAQSAGKRVLISLAMLVLLWIGVVWAVAIP